MAGMKQNMAPMWKKLMKNVDLHEPTSFLDHVYSWVYSTWMQTKWNYYWEVQRNVWLTYFCWSNWKFTRMGKTSRDYCSVDIRYGRSCSKMRGKVFELVKKKKTEQLYKVSSPGLEDHQIKKQEGAWISWRIIWSMLTNCLKMFVFGQK